MTHSRYPRYAFIAIISAAALAFALALFPWHVLRGPLASYASYRLHRDVTIGGLDVGVGRITRIQLDDVSIGNTPGSEDSRMAHASRMVLFFSLGALLKGEPDYLQLVEPDVLLEKNAEGVANWHFDEGDTAFWPEVTAIDVDRGPSAIAIPRFAPTSARVCKRRRPKASRRRCALAVAASCAARPSSWKGGARAWLRCGAKAIRTCWPSTRVRAGRRSISTVRSFRAIRRICEGRCTCGVPICRCSIRSYRPRCPGRLRTASKASSRTPRSVDVPAFQGGRWG